MIKGKAKRAKLSKLCLTLFLVFALCLSLLTVAGASNGSGTPLLEVPADITGEPGASVEVPVYLTSEGQVTGVEFKLAYDPALLAFTGAAVGDFTAGFTVEAAAAAGTVQVLVYKLPVEGIAAGRGTVALLNFTVHPAAQAGDWCDLPLSDVVLVDDTQPIPGVLEPVTLQHGSFAVPAADPPILEVPADITGEPGASVEVPVYLTSEGQVTGLEFELAYDPLILEFTGAAVGDFTAGFTVEAAAAGGKVQVLVYKIPVEGIPAGRGTVALLSFTVHPAAQAGDWCDLPLSDVVLVDDAQPIPGVIEPVTLQHGRFEAVPLCTKGDVNADGDIDIFDVILARNIALGSHVPTFLEFCAADMNDDGQVNILDVLAILNLALAFVAP